MSDPRFLVTGAYGCIGAWVAAELVADGRPVVTFDLSTEPRRLRLLLDADAVAAIPHVAGDITDLAALERAIDEHGITHVIHLAALQVPFCRADPPLGARVNVLGTVNVFEAAKARPQLAPITYACSIAAFDAERDDGRAPGDDLRRLQARERVDGRRLPRRERHLEHGPAAAHGLRRRARPGRDVGADDRDARRRGRHGLHDPVRRRRAAAARARRRRARSSPRASPATRARPCTTCPGAASRSQEIVATLGAGSIGFDDVRLPFPEEVDSASFTAGVPRLRRDAARRRRRGDRRPLPRPPRRGPRPTTQSKEPDEQLELPRRTGSRASATDQPKVVCVGLNYCDHTGESQMEPPKAPLLFGKFANTLCARRRRDRAAGRRRPRRRRGRAGARDRPHRERRVEGRRARVRRRLDVRERRLGARLPVRRRPVVPRQEPRHVLPGRPARRAARRARREPTCGSSSG